MSPRLAVSSAGANVEHASKNKATSPDRDAHGRAGSVGAAGERPGIGPRPTVRWPAWAHRSWLTRRRGGRSRFAGRRTRCCCRRSATRGSALAAVITSLQVLGQTAFGFQLSIAQILVSLLTCAILEFGITFRQRPRDHVAGERAPDGERDRVRPARARHRARRLVEHERLVDLRRHGGRGAPLEAPDPLPRPPLPQPLELRHSSSASCCSGRRGPIRSPSGGGRCRRGWCSRSGSSWWASSRSCCGSTCSRSRSRSGSRSPSASA